METILVLTDFSEISLHAAEYACTLSRQLNVRHIVLYHAYQVIPPVSSGAEAITGQFNYNVVADSFSPEDARLLREGGLQGLEAEKKLLAAAAGDDIVIECATDEIRLADSINDIAEKYHAGLVVLGISEKEGLERILFGSTANGVVDGSKYPVLLVPLKAAIEPVRRIVFAYDLEKVDRKFPGAELKQLLDAFGATLKVVHVDKDHSGSEAGGPGSMPDLDPLLESYHPSFHFIENHDIVEGILHYAGENQASLILAIGKDQGFLKNLFHRRITHKLAYDTSTPLLVIQERNK
jgi:nucleotide-binding universal stress UspA family protein